MKAFTVIMYFLAVFFLVSGIVHVNGEGIKKAEYDIRYWSDRETENSKYAMGFLNVLNESGNNMSLADYYEVKSYYNKYAGYAAEDAEYVLVAEDKRDSYQKAATVQHAISGVLFFIAIVCTCSVASEKKKNTSEYGGI